MYAKLMICRTVCFCLLVLCPLVVLTESLALWQAWSSTTWPTVTGTIHKTSIQRSNAGHTARVEYHYTVAGREYYSERQQLGPAKLHREHATALQALAAYRPGTRVQVHYDPQQPQLGVLTKGLSAGQLTLLLALSAGTLLGGAGLLGLALFNRSLHALRRLERRGTQAADPKRWQAHAIYMHLPPRSAAGLSGIA